VIKAIAYSLGNKTGNQGIPANPSQTKMKRIKTLRAWSDAKYGLINIIQSMTVGKMRKRKIRLT